MSGNQLQPRQLLRPLAEVMHDYQLHIMRIDGSIPAASLNELPRVNIRGVSLGSRVTVAHLSALFRTLVRREQAGLGAFYVYLDDIDDPSVVACLPPGLFVVLHAATNIRAVTGLPAGVRLQIDDASPEVVAQIPNKSYMICALGGNISPAASARLPAHLRQVTLGSNLTAEAASNIPTSVLSFVVTMESDALAIRAVTQRTDTQLDVHSAKDTAAMAAIRPGTMVVLHGCCEGLTTEHAKHIPAGCDIHLADGISPEIVAALRPTAAISFTPTADPASVERLSMENRLKAYLDPNAGKDLVMAFFKHVVLDPRRTELQRSSFIDQYVVNRAFKSEFYAAFPDFAPTVRSTAARSSKRLGA